MKKLIISCLFLSCLFLNGCTIHSLRPYQPNVEQGNVITPAMIDQIKLGMTKNQVSSILGDPLLSSVFYDNYWAYVYTFQRSGGHITKKRLDLYFQNDRVVRIVDEYTPTPTK